MAAHLSRPDFQQTSRALSYDRTHQQQFRAAVLARDPLCVLCRTAPGKHADRYPPSRRELVTADRDPNDPQHGGGLCGRCHSSETARHQPGGWNNR
ncbi:hypothetical protein [Kitasatospora sp. HPMI-4]|uniref:hypothetical protein n=1 Tax=Kitasatospora sp. HPMI-4 TaxID=3448443 RepID=UPI003F1D5608